jgi:hypothetical protein
LPRDLEYLNELKKDAAIVRGRLEIPLAGFDSLRRSDDVMRLRAVRFLLGESQE